MRQLCFRLYGWQGLHVQISTSYPDLDGIVSSLVDAQLLLRFLGVHGHLQLVQQAHIPAIIIQHVDPCKQQQDLSNPGGVQYNGSNVCHYNLHNHHRLPMASMPVLGPYTFESIKRCPSQVITVVHLMSSSTIYLQEIMASSYLNCRHQKESKLTLAYHHRSRKQPFGFCLGPSSFSTLSICSNA